MMTHRSKLLASTLLAAMAPTPLWAQAAAPAATVPDATPADDAAPTIVVTGSLLSNPNLAQSAPVNVTTAEEITLRQSNVAEEVLRDIPGVVPNVGSQVNNGNGGSSFVDLRGLGANRNIVLLDGNRIAPSGLAGQVDLNNIPLALVDRVDALTGGASTTYGADAVSGVVNFITKKDFTGVEVSLGEQITEQGDGNFARADVTLGAGFDDGRGNAVFSIGYQESDPVYQGDRDFARNAIDSFTGTQGGSGTAVPSRFSGTRALLANGQPNTTPLYTQTGVTANGTPILTKNATGTNNSAVSFINPATGATGPGQLFNFNPYNVFQTPFKRFNMYGQANYQASDAIEVYTRGLFSKNTVNTIIAPSGVFGSGVAISLNNPYLPAALRTQLCALNIAPVVNGVDANGNAVSAQATYTPRFTPAECAAAATATGPNDPNYRVFGTNQTVNGTNVNPSVALSRRLVEAGPRISSFTTTIFDYRAGLRGKISDHISWDVSGGYGESDQRQFITGYILTSRARQSLLTAGNACQDTSNGCVPVNFFGAAGSITPQQAAFMQGNSQVVIRTSLAQARALLKGDIGVTSPLATDAIGFAAGTEYRHYKANQTTDSLAKSGDLGGFGAAPPDIAGGYDVYEAFGELALPLVQDKAFFQDLSLEAGIRYSHYTVETPGSPKFNTTTWKIGGSWQPVRDIKFRGNYSHAVRAPNITELFTPQVTALTNLATDPCAGAAPVGNANLRAICIAQGAPASTIGTITNPNAGQANATGGGTTALKPETSNSYTFGTVLTPQFLRGLSLTADYYNITINKAITAPTPGDAILGCFGNITATSAASTACTNIRRNPLTGTLDGDTTVVRGLFLPLSNQGRLKTDGIDVALNYQTPLGFIGDDVKLKLSFTGNYTFHAKFKSNAADPASLDRDCVGKYSVNCASIQPKFQWNQRTTLSVGDIDVSLLWQHIDGVKYEQQQVIDSGQPVFTGTLNTPGDPYYNGRTVNFSRIKPYDKFDLSMRFGLTKNVDLTLAVQNLFDRTPPLVGYDLGSTAFNSGNTYPSTYDALGRRYAAGVKMKF
jgi:iron complex outermembrane recepter protein